LLKSFILRIRGRISFEPCLRRRHNRADAEGYLAEVTLDGPAQQWLVKSRSDSKRTFTKASRRVGPLMVEVVRQQKTIRAGIDCSKKSGRIQWEKPRRITAGYGRSSASLP
jgi:hypothetical protein